MSADLRGARCGADTTQQTARTRARKVLGLLAVRRLPLLRLRFDRCGIFLTAEEKSVPKRSQSALAFCWPVRHFSHCRGKECAQEVTNE